MSWLITFGVFIGIFLVGFLGVSFIDGIFEWDEYGTRTWKGYFSLIVVVVLFIFTFCLLHHGIVTRHLFGV